MSSGKISTLLAILVTVNWVLTTVSSASHSAAPAPAVDCSSVVLNLVDCLSFVTNATVTKPQGSCCSGLKSVLKSNPECLCEAFQNSAQFGVTINVTKATALPSACKVSAPSVSNCGKSIGGEPAMAPSVMPPSPVSDAPSPHFPQGSHDHAPAPSPGSSGSSLPAFSTVSAVLGLALAFISLY